MLPIRSLGPGEVGLGVDLVLELAGVAAVAGKSVEVGTLAAESEESSAVEVSREGLAGDCTGVAGIGGGIADAGLDVEDPSLVVI